MIEFFLLVILGSADVAATKDAAQACRVGAQRDAIIFRVALDAVRGKMVARRLRCEIGPAGATPPIGRTGATGAVAE